MDKINIQHILKSKEWADVEGFLRKYFNNIEIDPSQPVIEVGQRALAKMMAIEAFESAVNDLHAIKNQKDKKNIVYK